MGCEYQSICPSCVRMYAFEEASGRGLCAQGEPRCARFERMRREGWVPLTLMPSGENLDTPLVRGARAGNLAGACLN